MERTSKVSKRERKNIQLHYYLHKCRIMRLLLKTVYTMMYRIVMNNYCITHEFHSKLNAC